MVKWLEEITVTESESDNFYHYHDNRVLPSHVTEQLAKSEGMTGCSLAFVPHVPTCKHVPLVRDPPCHLPMVWVRGFAGLVFSHTCFPCGL